MVATRGKGDSKEKIDNFYKEQNSDFQEDFCVSSGVRRSYRRRKISDASWCFDDKQLKGYPNKQHEETDHDDSLLSSEKKLGSPRVMRLRSKNPYSKCRRPLRFRSDHQLKIISPLRTRNFRRNSLPDRRESALQFREVDSNDGEDEDEDDVSRYKMRSRTRGNRFFKSEEMQRNEPESMDESHSDFNASNQKFNHSSEAKTEDESSANDKMEGSIKSKRVRKPVNRLTYDASKGKRASKQISSSSSSESEDDIEKPEENGDRAAKSRRRYSLRQNKPLVKYSYKSFDERRFRHSNRSDDLLSSARKHRSMFNNRYRATHNTALSSTSSSSSSDEKEFEKRKSKSMKKARSQCLPMNFEAEDAMRFVGRERQNIGRSLADIDPMYVDKNITFASIGGLDDHVKSLKEMILFPLMYPEVFSKFDVTPPRGVLFYGCPGTGKTMVARALAAECGRKDKKVAFFMRKGADCLSKWVGESERQLRLLFDQAYQMRPSIIFFDEVDGLAPVRSSRQDQIHSSIVSTLLALMDGLDDRGQVIVIGATNRVDAIDPALRRPGRFDREFYFPLPTVQSRRQILDIHTSKWQPKLDSDLLQYLADETVGYCGADLKALCGEAALNALRSRYPQIYKSDQKLLLDIDQIEIHKCHFNQSLAKLVPAGQRASASSSRKLSDIMKPLLQPWLTIVLSSLKKIFPFASKAYVGERMSGGSKLLLAGTKGQGQTQHLAPAVLHALEGLPTYRLDFPLMFSSLTKSPEETCVHAFQEAVRNAPSILYFPLIDHWWQMSVDSLKTTFTCLLKQLNPSLPILIFATSEMKQGDLYPDLQEIFDVHRSEVITVTNPKEVLRKSFFHPLFYTEIFKKPDIIPELDALEHLPVAPPIPARPLTAQEIKLVEREEEATLRELRIFLREICAKLAKNRLFYIFTKPVDEEEVPDYRDVISNPMDLETVMTNIDNHCYVCAEDFLDDIDLICENALEYNPATNQEDKMIRHRACSLRDTAYAFIKAEMDTDFEDKCQSIRDKRKERREGNGLTEAESAAYKSKSAENRNGDDPTSPNSQGVSRSCSFKRKRRRSAWSRGLIVSNKPKEKRRKISETQENGDAEDTNHVPAEQSDDKKADFTSDKETTVSPVPVAHQNGNVRVSPRKHLSSNGSDNAFSPNSKDDLDGIDAFSDNNIDEPAKSTSVFGKNASFTVVVDRRQLDALFGKCVAFSDHMSADDLHYFYMVIQRLIQNQIDVANKENLLSMIRNEMEKFFHRKIQ